MTQHIEKHGDSQKFWSLGLSTPCAARKLSDNSSPETSGYSSHSSTK